METLLEWANILHDEITCVVSYCANNSGILTVQIFIPPPNEVGGGVYWIHLVRPSVCPSVCLKTTWFPEHKSSLLWNINFKFHMHVDGGYTPAQLDSPCPSIRPSVRPSVCRRHGFWSISQVCFGISISNFICMLMVAIGRRLLIFIDVTFKMAAWRPYWNFWFPDSNFTLALNINFKLQQHNTLCIWVGDYWFSAMSFSKWPPGGHIRFFGFWTL